MKKPNNNNNKIIFWGTPVFAVPSLDVLNNLNLVSLVITQPDRPAGRGKKLISSPVKDYALEHNLPVLAPDKLDNDFLEKLKKYLPATFVVVAYGKLIAQEILDLSDKTALNIHPSMLPILRGPSPIQSAILRGFDTTGVSLMQMDKKMDHGPILSQIEAKIGQNDDYISLSEYLSQLGANLLKNSILNYLSGQMTPLPQDDSRATYCQMINKEDGQIEWSKTALEIDNQVRAYLMWPTAYTNFNGLDVKILKTKVVDENISLGQIKFDKKNIFLGTKDKAIQILELKPAGKKAMTAEEFIRGYSKYLSK